MSKKCNCDSGLGDMNCDCSEYCESHDCDQSGSTDNKAINRVSGLIITSRTCHPFVSTSTIYDGGSVHAGNLIDHNDIRSMWGKLEEVARHFDMSSAIDSRDDVGRGYIIDNRYLINIIDNINSLLNASNPVIDRSNSNSYSVYSKTREVRNNIDNGEIVRASHVNGLLEAITNERAHCRCVSNSNTQCCWCNVVCSCNYNDKSLKIYLKEK